MLEIIWKQGATNDLLEVFAARDELRAGAGEVFVTRLDVTLQNLRVHPWMAPVFNSPMRRLVLGNTGFGLFYTVEGRRLIIHALVHLSQNPDSVRARVRRLLDLN